MKVYVYNTDDTSSTCYPEEKPRLSDYLVQVIECEETLAPISSFADPILIGIGEVFGCNDVNSNLIRTA